jgi:hypothetical protein
VTKNEQQVGRLKNLSLLISDNLEDMKATGGPEDEN